MWWSLEADGGYITSRLLKTQSCGFYPLELWQARYLQINLSYLGMCLALPNGNINFVTYVNDFRNIWHVANKFSASIIPVPNVALILTPI